MNLFDQRPPQSTDGQTKRKKPDAHAAHAAPGTPGTPGTAATPWDHHVLTCYWLKRWWSVYSATDRFGQDSRSSVGGGSFRGYPFSARDGRHIHDLLRLCGGVLQAQRAIENYLAQRGDFYRGHPLSILIAQLPKFVVASGAEQCREAAQKMGAISNPQRRGRLLDPHSND